VVLVVLVHAVSCYLYHAILSKCEVRVLGCAPNSNRLPVYWCTQVVAALKEQLAVSELERQEAVTAVQVGCGCAQMGSKSCTHFHNCMTVSASLMATHQHRQKQSLEVLTSLSP
jgi:hypothetical protein